MKIYLATDHAGFNLKETIKEFLLGEEYEVEDLGAHAFDKADDYTAFISKAGEKISQNPFDKAIIFGGSGEAEAMLANKYLHVRTALFYGPKVLVREADATGRQSSDPYELVRLTRLHNNANILSIGARFVSDEEALTAVKLWLETPFSEEERHVRRIQKIEEIEKELHEQN